MADDEMKKYIESYDATFNGEIEDLDLPEEIKEKAIKFRDGLNIGESKDDLDAENSVLTNASKNPGVSNV